MKVRLKYEVGYGHVDIYVQNIVSSVNEYRFDLPAVMLTDQTTKLKEAGYTVVGDELKLSLGKFLDKVERIWQ